MLRFFAGRTPDGVRPFLCLTHDVRKEIAMEPKRPSQGLWTWDFTIITVGSVISLIGGVLSNFGMSIMVLDYTGSVFLYALFNASYQIPMLVCPVLAGPYLDRMSRKKAIYRLDFLSAGLFAGLFLLLRTGWFSYPALLAFSLVRGSIDSIYLVAYDSLYPNLVEEHNLSNILHLRDAPVHHDDGLPPGGHGLRGAGRGGAAVRHQCGVLFHWGLL